MALYDHNSAKMDYSIMNKLDNIILKAAVSSHIQDSSNTKYLLLARSIVTGLF